LIDTVAPTSGSPELPSNTFPENVELTTGLSCARNKEGVIVTATRKIKEMRCFIMDYKLVVVMVISIKYIELID